MFSAIDTTSFIMPVCYHPTTILAVDDDIDFLENLAVMISEKLKLLCFEKPEAAIDYIKKELLSRPFTSRCLEESIHGLTFNFMRIREEIYNPNRFKEIFMCVTDYDMPQKNGIELIRTMEFPHEISQYAHILLTGKISTEFKEKLTTLGLSTEYIGKDDPQYIDKLLTLVDKRLARIFQWYSYIPARLLSRSNEKTSFLFDGNFSSLFNAYIKENHICELYLFDKQGSYVFLDQKGNLSWLFIRNEIGIENTIHFAKQYGAPKTVLDAIQSKEVILSLYEKEDFERRKKIEWEDYLLPANVFQSGDAYLHFLPNLMPQTKEGHPITPRYYYAFSTQFPEHGIDHNQILSYEDFLADEVKS